MNTSLIIFFLIIVILFYFRLRFWITSLAILLFLFAIEVKTSVLITFLVPLLILNLTFIRRYLFSLPLMKLIKKLKLLPKISETEKIALESGTVWMEGEFFTGKPNLKKLFNQKICQLTKEEEEFINGPTDKLCSLVNDWNVYKKRDFEAEVWKFMKDNKFFGIIIPKKYGGLEFSAEAHSRIIQKLASRTPSLGITVMVPNSLGPAELIIHYGTDEQKNYYLPRLASGQEIPCFALTEPLAGSDAGSITSSGVIFKKEDGTIWMRLNWNKRYITLASISTLLGIAFKMSDPENILGGASELGITCALIPSETKGVIIGNRHDPLTVPFINSPTQGVNVELPISNVIGGKTGIGNGWKMLMECLAAGRGISLPASSNAGTKYVLRVVSAYASVRKQFGLPIGKFEGIDELIAQIAGFAYINEALRSYTCSAVDAGAKPAVVTAISKYHSTEINRKAINFGMDILGGAAISLGPKNLLASPYFAAPIAITVEGANILTRSLIIFGQGLIRSHPFILKEMYSLEEDNLTKFDEALFGHLYCLTSNFLRSFVLFFTRGFLVFKNGTCLRRYAQKLVWVSTYFSLFSDFAIFTLGGDLKRKEKISARFGDVLSWLYISSAIINKFENGNKSKSEYLFAKWSLEYSFAKIQESFEALLENFGLLGKLENIFIRLNRFGKTPSDKLSGKIVREVLQNKTMRDLVTDGVYIPKNEDDTFGKLELAFKTSLETKDAVQKLQNAIKKKLIPKSKIEEAVKNGVGKNIISKEEGDKILQFEKLAKEVVQVDDFTSEEYYSFHK